MTHYQKLATIAFRIIGTFFLVFGAIAAIIALIFIVGGETWAVAVALFYSIPSIVFGIVFFSLSRRLAKWVCFDFDKFNEQ